jgi:hypothetical protein
VSVELLYLDGCPSYEALLPRLQELLREAGLEGRVELRHVETPEEAEAERFLGSPSLRINGRDIDPGAHARTDFGLKCRIYRGPGGASPVPPDEWIIDALKGSSRAVA